jgi:hypothetical protein
MRHHNDTAPILITCEGNGSQPNLPSEHDGLCPMCGLLQPLNTDGTITNHQRDDILARITRGDYG